MDRDSARAGRRFARACQRPVWLFAVPVFVCLLGGLLIGLYEKMTGTKTDDLNQVMAKVKQDGRYPYDNLGKLSLAALLPLLFGGSIGPEPA